MSSSFLEENVFLPGTPDEQEDQKKTWEQLLAEDVALQTAPPPPPVAVTPPPSDPGFTSGSESATYAPPAPVQQVAPPPPPPDPMQQALGGLQETLFQEQNTQLPEYNPMQDYSSDFMTEGLENFQTAYEVGQIEPLIAKADELGQYIEDYNKFGILPPQFSTPQDLQVAYDAVASEFDTVSGNYEGALQSEQDRLLNMLQGKLTSRQNIGQHRAVTQETFEGGQFDQSRLAALQQPEPFFTQQDVINSELRIRDEQMRLNDLRVQDPFYDSYRYDLETEAFNEELIRAVGRTGNTDLMRFARGSEEEFKRYHYRDDQGNIKYTFSEDFALGELNRLGYDQTIGAGSLLAGTAAAAISGVGSAGESLGKSLYNAYPKIVQEQANNALTLAKIEVGAGLWAWDQLPEGVRSELTRTAQIVWDFPEQLAANFYVAVKDPSYGNITTALSGAPLTPAFGSTSADAAQFRESQDEILSQWRDEVPLMVQIHYSGQVGEGWPESSLHR